MPESLKVLRRRIRTIESTKKVTRAMEMVAASKLRRSQGVLLSSRPYVEQLRELLARLAPRAEAAGHPLFVHRKVRHATLVLYTADRGLCGGYNANLIRMAEHKLKEHRLGQMELVCVGKMGARYFERRHWPIAKTFGDFNGEVDPQRSQDITEYLRERYVSEETDEVYLLYSRFISAAVSRPTYRKFLDLDVSAVQREAGEMEDIDYLFEPSATRVFESMVPQYLRSMIFISLAEAFTSEHSARMLAMNNASKNCDELADTLTLRLNKARQTGITSDLLDICGGAEALQQGA